MKQRIFFSDEVKSMLDVLRLGISLHFDDGNRINSSVETAYIEPVLDGEPLGLWIMDEEGVKSSLRDLGYRVKE